MNAPNATRDRSADLQIVLRAIARTAAKVCEANDALIILVQGDKAAVVARHGFLPTRHKLGEAYPLTDDMVGNRVITQRRTIHLRDLSKAPRGRFVGSKAAHLPLGVRTMLVTPLLRDGDAIGAIGIRRTKVQPFTPKQVALLKTFANQAAIAIENARLFTELQEKNSALTAAHAQVTESLEQQTATSEILRVISSSPNDVQPVFDAIAKNGTTLCDAAWGAVIRFDGQLLTLMAQHNMTPSELELISRTYPRTPTRGRATGRAIIDRRTVHVPDIREDPDYLSPFQQALGFRTVLAVPMLRDGEPIGVLALWRREVRQFTDQQIALVETFADQAVIAIENVRLFTELQEKNEALTQAHAQVTESLEQQTATSELLKVIGRSTFDLQPVFETLAQNAVRLCEAEQSSIFRFDGQVLRLVAANNASPENRAFLEQHPIAPGRHSASARAALERRIVHIHDVESDPEYTYGVKQVEAIRTVLAIPMLRAGELLGVILIYRHIVRPFSDSHIALMETFADQAVIAIENVRLFTELQEKNRALAVANSQVTEALDHQTATSDILRVISQSPTDLEPVFQTVIARALRLAHADYGAISLMRDDTFHLAASHAPGEGVAASFRVFPLRLDQSGLMQMAVRSRAVAHTANLFEDARVGPFARELASATGYHAFIHAPLMRRDVVIGILTVIKREPGPFSSNEVSLLQTFADQAVIAIENVRLFKELEARNTALTEALNQQTATAEILGVLSASPTQVQPVFDAIVASAVRLCNGVHGAILRVDGNVIDHVAQFGHDMAVLEEIRRHFPQPMDYAAPSSPVRAIRERRVVEVPDTETTPGVPDFIREAARRQGFRSELWVPMLRGENAIGTLVVTRREPGRFTNEQVALLRTFADQAVIAIENVRLFKELEARNRDLSATGEILQVISRSPTDAQPVFDTIVASAVRLCEGLFGTLWQFDGELIHQVAQYNYTPEALEGARRLYPSRPSRAHGSARAILERAVIHIPDREGDPEFQAHPLARAVGWRSGLFVPMLREGSPVGAIGVTRAKPGPFTAEQIVLLQTFADQAVIAIENVQLFKELQTSNRELATALEQQTATSDILRVISSSPTDIQHVFDTIVERAARLCDARLGALLRFDGQMIHLAAHTHLADAESVRALQMMYPTASNRTNVSGRALLWGRPVHVRDMREDPELVQVPTAQAGHRTVLSVPMMREGAPIGAITMARAHVEPFSDAQIELLKTFADQAVIAIENVRLFTELQEKNRAITAAHAQVIEALDQQTATSEILRVISRSPTDVQPVFDTIVRSAARLCHATMSWIWLLEGDWLKMTAPYNVPPGNAAGIRVADAPNATRVIREGTIHHIGDTEDDSRMTPEALKQARTLGVRAVLVVPMRRDREAIGALAVYRASPGSFSDSLVELLQTFTDQAVIAIENVRLFKELQARTGELTRSVGELRALGEVSQALSSTLDVDIVLNTIVTRANDLIGADGCTIFEYDEVTEQFHLRATRNLEPGLVELARGTPLRKGDQGILGQLPMGRQAVQVPDITAGSYSSPISAALIEAGYRAVVAVPLIREDHLIGALTMNRKTPGEFPHETIELLQTFATQSALAIQNARLFREIEQKSRELEAASRHKSEFLANMSHELRTPLNAVIGFSEVLSEGMFGQLNDKQEEYARDIYTSGQHLLSLINDILDLSKIEAGRMELEITEFHLPAALDNALTLVRERAGRRGIALGMTVDERLGQVRADERKIRQVVLNLLSNAIKFTPEGGRIEVRAAPVDGAVEVSVTDTGVGIAPEDQEAIFDEFKQVGTAAKKVEGTGLGLALSRKFVELHCGRIWVKSEVGAGSTFTFTIPMLS